MDLITIVLIFIFFILPVIQQIREQRRKRGSPEPDPEWESIRVGAPEEVRRPRRPAAESGAGTESAWSEGWGAWPESSLETEAVEITFDVPPPPVPAPPTVPGPRPERRARPVPPEPVRLEPIVLPRAESRRASVEVEPRSAAPGSLRRQTVRPRQASKPAPSKRPALNDTGSLRRAVILRELLGPPLALRSYDADRADFH